MYRFPPRLLATLLLSTTPLAAQEVPPVAPTPTATPTPLSEPLLEPSVPIVLPSPAATPTPRAVETPIARPSPRPTVTPSPAPVPSPTLSPTPSPRPSATAVPPTVIASPLPTTDDRGDGGSPAWPWMLGAGVLLVGGIGLWLARRQRPPEDGEVAVDPTDAAALEPPAYLAPAVGSSPLVLRFRPTRVGFNMLSATAEGELTVVNEGAAPASGLRVRAGLLGAHAGQEADVADFLAQPMGRPVAPMFDLAPGERRTLRVIAAVPREAMRTLTAAGRPMFVPVLVADVHANDGTQVAQGFAIGAERVDSAKLAPFWLDVPDRAYTAVAAREHGTPVVRRG